MPRTLERAGFLTNPALRLILFGGKGGVGKTTCAAASASALAASRPHDTFLLISTDPAHSLRHCLRYTPLPANLEVRELDAAACLRDFQHAHRDILAEIATRGTFLDAEDSGRLLDLSLPGLDEVMGFLELAGQLEHGEYACVIVDTAPTGHTLRLLAMPELLKDWLRAVDALLAKERYMRKVMTGRYQADAADAFLAGQALRIKDMESLLHDAERCTLVPVMLAEAPVLAETRRLLAALERLEIPAQEMVINQWPTPDEPDFPAQHAVLQAFRPAAALWCLPRLSGEPGAQFRLDEWLGRLRRFPCASPASSMSAIAELPLVCNPALLPPVARKLHLFAGKGGVGKTTLACATALRLAARATDQPVLLLSCDPAHSLSDCLQTPLESRPTQVCTGLEALELNADADFQALKQGYAEEVGVFFDRLAPGLDLPFDRAAAERLLDLAPSGVDELIALLHVMDTLEHGEYACIVLDTAPSGHLLRLLELPELMTQWLQTLFSLFLKYREWLNLPNIKLRLVQLSKNLKALRALLQDPQQAALYAVARPQPLVLEETAALLDACARLGLACPVLCYNFLEQDSAAEKNALAAFAAAYPAAQHSEVARRVPPPVGVKALRELGEALWYRFPEKDLEIYY